MVFPHIFLLEGLDQGSTGVRSGATRGPGSLLSSAAALLAAGLGGAGEEGGCGDGQDDDTDEDVGEGVRIVTLDAGPHFDELGRVLAPIVLLGGALDVGLSG